MTKNSVVLRPPGKELFNFLGLHCSEVLKVSNSIKTHLKIIINKQRGGAISSGIEPWLLHRAQGINCLLIVFVLIT